MMIYTPMTNRALRLAADAHRGQTDKAGMPYLLHPFHLAEQMTDEISLSLHDPASRCCGGQLCDLCTA